MNLYIRAGLLTLGILSLYRVSYSQETEVEQAFRFTEAQATLQLQEVRRLTGAGRVSPRTLDAGGQLVLVPPGDWTSGFFPGILWLLYGHTKENKWQEAAREATAKLENEQYNGRTHDMGFKIYCSYGQGYRLTGDTAYRKVIIRSAQTLATRFNPVVGCIRSWDHNRDRWEFPVIIDNMLNLELLFAATKLTGDSTFYRIAVTHANTTLKNHFRPDGGTYHVIDYDPGTGKIRNRHTHQGFSHESTWARGQAWALYGYTLCYRETGEEQYLRKALDIASWLQNHPRFPEDGVPYWDFDAPGIPHEPRDASAAAIIASALYELQGFVPGKPGLRGLADRITHSLVTAYTAQAGTHSGFTLLHSTGAKPSGSEVDVPLIYADYYLLEALTRKKNTR